MITGLRVWDRDGKQIFLSKKNNLKIIGRQQINYEASLLDVVHHINYEVPQGSNRVFIVSCSHSDSGTANVLPAHVWDTDTGLAWSYIDDGNQKVSCMIFYGYI